MVAVAAASEGSPEARSPTWKRVCLREPPCESHRHAHTALSGLHGGTSDLERSGAEPGGSRGADGPGGHEAAARQGKAGGELPGMQGHGYMQGRRGDYLHLMCKAGEETISISCARQEGSYGATRSGRGAGYQSPGLGLVVLPGPSVEAGHGLERVVLPILLLLGLLRILSLARHQPVAPVPIRILNLVSSNAARAGGRALGVAISRCKAACAQ
eukprot:SAG31_NODE_510_length_14725_cov_2.829482_7_plen_214_part_00